MNVCLSCVHTCSYIDGRVWPEQDELEVRLMMDLIKHVTGKESSSAIPLCTVFCICNKSGDYKVMLPCSGSLL